MGIGLRYFGGAVAFGFAAVWIMASLAAALVCLVSAVLGYGVLSMAEGLRARRTSLVRHAEVSRAGTLALAGSTPHAEDLPQWADSLNGDLGHIFDPAATASPLAREAEYGWPLDKDTGSTSSTLH